MISVLIVDDDPRVREILSRWLTPAGYEAREAGDAESALAALSSSPADVVLCDVRMPGHDGLWLVERMREQFPTVAIVLATALETVPPAISLRSGVVEYIVKPFAREGVLDAVSRAVVWRQAAEGGPVRAGSPRSVSDWINGPGPGLGSSTGE